MKSKDLKEKKYSNYILLAKGFLDSENYYKAESSLQKALKFADTKSQRINVLFEIADINIIYEKYDKAKDIFQEILIIDSECSGAYYGLSLVNDLCKGEIEYSIKNYHRAIELDPLYDRAYYYLAHAYDRLGNDKMALRLLFKCIELNNRDYISYNDIGAIYEQNEDFEKAKIFFEKSLEINPNYGRALYNMGVVLRNLGDKDLALDYYYMALENSKHFKIYLNISALYFEDKDFEKAIDILDVGLVNNPQSVDLLYNRACAKARLNMVEDAKKDLVYANKLDPTIMNWACKDLDLVQVIKIM